MMKNQNCLDKVMQIGQEMLTLTDQHLAMFLATIIIVSWSSKKQSTVAKSSAEAENTTLGLATVHRKLYGYVD